MAGYVCGRWLRTLANGTGSGSLLASVPIARYRTWPSYCRRWVHMRRTSRLRAWANRDDGRFFRVGNTRLRPSVAAGALLWLAALVVLQFARVGAIAWAWPMALALLGVLTILLGGAAGKLHAVGGRPINPRRDTNPPCVTIYGLTSQTLVSITTGLASYVGIEDNSDPLETKPVVLIFSASRLVIESVYKIEPVALTLQDLAGRSVVDAYSTDDEIMVLFDAGPRLIVSLRAEDHRGPEAASYEPNDGPILVFN